MRMKKVKGGQQLVLFVRDLGGSGPPASTSPTCPMGVG